jgi:hypothetical protein
MEIITNHTVSDLELLAKQQTQMQAAIYQKPGFGLSFSRGRGGYVESSTDQTVAFT